MGMQLWLQVSLRGGLAALLFLVGLLLSVDLLNGEVNAQAAGPVVAGTLFVE